MLSFLVCTLPGLFTLCRLIEALQIHIFSSFLRIQVQKCVSCVIGWIWTHGDPVTNITTSNDGHTSLTSSAGPVLLGERSSAANQQRLWSLLEKITEVKRPFLPIVTAKPISTASHGRWICGASAAHRIYKLEQENLWGVHLKVGALNFSLIPTPPHPAYSYSGLS